MQNHNNEWFDILSDYRVHWLPNNTNQLFAHSKLHMVDVFPEDILVGMLYYTPNTYKGSNNYVDVDVLSDWSFDKMPYYTHHTYKGAHPYVCVDVLSNCSVD